MTGRKMNGVKNEKILKYTFLSVLIGTLIVFIITVNLLVHIDGLAENITRTFARKLNYLISRVTICVPFSVTEFSVCVLVFVIVAAIAFIIYSLVKKRWKNILDTVLALTIAVLIAVSVFNMTSTFGYYRDDVLTAFGIEETDVNEERIDEALRYYISKLNETEKSVQRDDEGNPICPYTVEEMAKLVYGEYERLDTGGYLASHRVGVKPVAMSEIMAYTGIIGVCMPLTGEISINAKAYPSAFPELIAHEIAHSKGAHRENDANFTAYYLLLKSENDFLSYSAANSVVNVLLSSLKKTDKDLFEERYFSVSENVRTEWKLESKYYAKYNGFIEKISEAINNIFLKSNGVQNGTASYSDTVKYIISAFYHEKGAQIGL